MLFLQQPVYEKVFTFEPFLSVETSVMAELGQKGVRENSTGKWKLKGYAHPAVIANDQVTLRYRFLERMPKFRRHSVGSPHRFLERMPKFRRHSVGSPRRKDAKG